MGLDLDWWLKYVSFINRCCYEGYQSWWITRLIPISQIVGCPRIASIVSEILALIFVTILMNVTVCCTIGDLYFKLASETTQSMKHLRELYQYIVGEH